MLRNTVLTGDCLELLRSTPSDSIDTIVCDPPYGLGTKEPTSEQIDAYLRGSPLYTGGDFMGMEWGFPSVDVWRECFRVLRPGRHICAFSSTRTWDILLSGMKVAGFIEDGALGTPFGMPLVSWLHCLTEDTEILVDGHWASVNEFVTGRSALCYDLSQGIFSWQPIQQQHIYPYSGSVYHIRGSGTDHVVTPGHRCVVADEGRLVFRYAGDLGNVASVPVVPDLYGLLGAVPFGSGTHAGQQLEISKAEVSREIYQGIVWCVTVPTGAFVARRSGMVFVTGNSQGFPKSLNISRAILKAGGSEQEARRWEGYGTALKPTWEPIITLRKPGPMPEGLPTLSVPFMYCPKVTPSESDNGIDTREYVLGMSDLDRNVHPCLHPTSLVMTPSGYREIDSISVGDLVLSADGRFHSVEAVSRHPYTSRDLVCIRVSDTDMACLASDNHPFLVWRPSLGRVLWVRADELAIEDCTLTPVVVHGISDKPILNDPWFLVGLYLVRGSGISGSDVMFHLNDSELRLVRASCNVAGHTVHGCGDMVKGVYDSNRGVLGSHVWDLPVESARALVEGFFAVGRQVTGISAGVLSQMFLLAKSVGYDVSIQRGELRLHDGSPLVLEHNGHTYCMSKVTSISMEPYDGDVINLSVGGSPTFQTSVGMSHNTRKPVALMEWLIKHTSDRDWLVLDPYCGSGSTLVAAVNTGRDFLGMEQNETYVNVARKRIEAAQRVAMAKAQDVFGILMNDD
jgi:hypothetical protein